MERDYFAKKAKGYELEQRRVQNVKNIADAIKAEIELKKEMEILDFGSGTGLLLKQLAPNVAKITALDRSISMNEQLRSSLDLVEAEVEILEMDIEKDTPKQSFDGIISSMTIHHIQDVQKLFNKFYSLLRDGGFIALADLEKEDGSFHSEDTGVRHFGFGNEEFLGFAKEAGFKDLKIQRVSIIKKPHRDFGVFLLTGYKRR